MTVEKAATHFLVTLSHEQLSVHTQRAYEQDLNQFVKEVATKELDDLIFEDFQSYFSMISTLKIATIKRKRVVLHRFLTFCYRKKMCVQRLDEFIDPIRHKKTMQPKEVLSKHEITAIFKYLEEEQLQAYNSRKNDYYEYLYYCSIRNQLLISCLLYTGCRAHEVVTIRKDAIDFEKNTITLLVKGNKYNQVPIHEQLLSAYKKYEEQCKEIEINLQTRLSASIYLFPSKDSTGYLSTRTLHDLMKKLGSVLNRTIHAHLFRHTFASYCIAANMDISTISSLISHSNPSITLSIYTHEIDAHNKQEQIKKLHFS